MWPLPPEPSLDEDALVPAMLATIGVAPESLLPIGAAKVPSPTAADANPTVAAAGGSKGKGTGMSNLPHVFLSRLHGMLCVGMQQVRPFPRPLLSWSPRLVVHLRRL